MRGSCRLPRVVSRTQSVESVDYRGGNIAFEFKKGGADLWSDFQIARGRTKGHEVMEQCLTP